MKSFVKDFLILLNPIGLNPLCRNVTKIAISVFIIVGFTIPLAMDLLFNWRGKSSIQGFADLVIVYQANCKYLLLVVCYKNFAELLNELETFWPINIFGVALEKSIYETYKTMKKFLRIYKFVYAITSGSYVAKPILTRSRMLLAPCFLFGIQTQDTPIFEIVFIFQTVYASLALVFQLGFDILFLVLVLHVVCELRLIKCGFARIKFDSDKKALKEFEQIARHHCQILKFVSKINHLYSLLLLNQFLTSTLIVCGALLILIADGFNSGVGELITYFLYLVTFMGQMFFYCFAGSRITEENESVSDAVYDLNWWYKTNPNLRRRMVLTILRANKSAKLSAGGVFDMNLHSYTDIVKTGMSFFTLVRTVYSKTDDVM